jgi:hypothetical protein
MINPVESVAKPKVKGDALEIESVADILEREHDALIQDWLSRADHEPDLAYIPLSYKNAPPIFHNFSMV